MKEHLQSLYALENYLTEWAEDYLSTAGIYDAGNELQVDDSAHQFATQIADATVNYYSDMMRLIKLFLLCEADFAKYWENAEQFDDRTQSLKDRTWTQAVNMVEAMAQDCFYSVINDQKEKATT